MRLSEHRTIKGLNVISTLIIGFYILFIIIKLFSQGTPTASNSIKGFMLYDMMAKPKNLKDTRSLEEWFDSKIIVDPTFKALVSLRVKSSIQLYSTSGILFQCSQLIYWLAIGYLLLCIKMLFSSFSKDQVFTSKNALIITTGAIIMMALPLIRWLTKELFISFINTMNLNDSGYTITNASSILGSETLIGFALLAFGLVFRAGVDLKNENESFI